MSASFDRIGSPGSLAREAIQAALARQQAAAQRLSAGPAAAPASGPDAFGGLVQRGIQEIARVSEGVDDLPSDLLEGGVTDFHQAASALKQSELALKFALQVRNKFVDAYREVMRMSV